MIKKKICIVILLFCTVRFLSAQTEEINNPSPVQLTLLQKRIIKTKELLNTSKELLTAFVAGTAIGFGAAPIIAGCIDIKDTIGVKDPMLVNYRDIEIDAQEKGILIPLVTSAAGFMVGYTCIHSGLDALNRLEKAREGIKTRRKLPIKKSLAASLAEVIGISFGTTCGVAALSGFNYL